MNIDDILKILDDPTVVPALRQERAQLVERTAKIDKFLALVGHAESRNTDLPGDPVLDRIRQMLRNSPMQRASIVAGTGLSTKDVSGGLLVLRVRGVVVSNGRRGTAALWSLVQ